MSTKIKRKPNPRQKRLVKELLDNPSSKKEAIIKAGYSPKTAIVPSDVLESASFKELLHDEGVMEQLKRIERRALDSIESKVLDDISYRDIVYGLKEVRNIIQLLGGGSTLNANIEYSWSNDTKN